MVLYFMKDETWKSMFLRLSNEIRYKEHAVFEHLISLVQFRCLDLKISHVNTVIYLKTYYNHDFRMTYCCIKHLIWAYRSATLNTNVNTFYNLFDVRTNYTFLNICNLSVLYLYPFIHWFCKYKIFKMCYEMNYIPSKFFLFEYLKLRSTPWFNDTESRRINNEFPI